MNILILDTETTGLAPEKGAKLIEVGALLYNVEHKVVLQTLSTFLPSATNEAEHINHIRPEWTLVPVDVDGAARMLEAMAKRANCIVAHNAQFDKRFMRLMPLADSFWEKPWVCTKDKFRWPVSLGRYRLEDICHAMGVPYIQAHRSLTDCHFLADCFTKVYDLAERFAPWA